MQLLDADARMEQLTGPVRAGLLRRARRGLVARMQLKADMRSFNTSGTMIVETSESCINAWRQSHARHSWPMMPDISHVATFRCTKP